MHAACRAGGPSGGAETITAVLESQSDYLRCAPPVPRNTACLPPSDSYLLLVLMRLATPEAGCGTGSRESLGTQPQASTSAPAAGAGVTILQEKQELRGADGTVCCFTVTLARSTVTINDDSLLQASFRPPASVLLGHKRGRCLPLFSLLSAALMSRWHCAVSRSIASHLSFTAAQLTQFSPLMSHKILTLACRQPRAMRNEQNS